MKGKAIKSKWEKTVAKRNWRTSLNDSRDDRSRMKGRSRNDIGELLLNQKRDEHGDDNHPLILIPWNYCEKFIVTSTDSWFWMYY